MKKALKMKVVLEKAEMEKVKEDLRMISMAETSSASSVIRHI